MSKQIYTMSHDRIVGADAIKEYVAQLERDRQAGFRIMDSTVLNDSIRGYVLASLNDCDSITADQKRQIMTALNGVFKDMNASEAAAYYDKHIECDL